jgi:aryl-alcohol dehydrogenase-like predicted oxidoreductase
VEDWQRSHRESFWIWRHEAHRKRQVNKNVRDMAKRYGATDWQIALKWMFNYSGNILLIPGTSSVSHLEENLKAVDVPLAQFDFDLINQEE